MFFIVNCEQISHLFVAFLLLTLSKQMLAGLKLFKRKKATVNQLWHQIFHKKYRKITASESPFDKAAGN